MIYQSKQLRTYKVTLSCRGELSTGTALAAAYVSCAGVQSRPIRIGALTDMSGI
jgi:hypothetical protein